MIDTTGPFPGSCWLWGHKFSALDGRGAVQDFGTVYWDILLSSQLWSEMPLSIVAQKIASSIRVISAIFE